MPEMPRSKVRRTDSTHKEVIHRLMLRREIVRTADGSASIHLPDWDESNHSRHGAIQEACHVFIDNGLNLFDGQVAILEMGFGTGLNALITLSQAHNRNLSVHYTGVEAYPVTREEAALLNYPDMIGHVESFRLMHQSEWDRDVQITPNFTLRKLPAKFADVHFESVFDLVYFDAFGYRFQPELWSESIFAAMFKVLKPGGILVTYAARTIIRRNMEAAGFEVAKMPGPPGKREMMRARKPI